MSYSPIASCLLNREQGDTQSFTSLDIKKNWSLVNITKKATIPTVHRNSTLLWISGRLNFIITLDNRGHVAIYDIFQDYKPTVLNENFEHVYKCIIIDNDLVTISKSVYDNTILFHKYSLAELQIYKIHRVQILEDIKIPLSCLKDINIRSATVLIEKHNTIEIWSLQDNYLLYSFLKSDELFYSFSSGFLIYWRKSQSNILIGVICFTTQSCKQFNLISNNDIYFCEISKGKLVVCIEGCHLQIIDLNNAHSFCIRKGAPKQYFSMSSSEASVVIFDDGTGMIIDKDIKEFRAINNDYCFSDIFGKPILCSAKHNELIIDCKPYRIPFTPKNIQQIGCNPDTQDIYLTEKGIIHILE
ncbi:hypothetical protein SteCoe_17067 [Stentor coeruleus]|uniref:Anaphase-promoting complex subunit 4 WD40 domain-containing protein n=1 Tax=Stentor coeruleus TaxID=5963 RepID=A0A1R2BZW1_9CILI|nr:hypothetical protein SteCoe_17067 [Stentor coeruleus]